jgi:ABC-type Mn2+/Zn2+ transport system permease subunit
MALVLVTFVVGLVVTLLRRPFLLLCVDDDIADTSGFRSSVYNAAMLGLIGVAVVASFQTVGTLLVFGMLLSPAATAALVTRRIGTMISVAAAVGSFSTWAGLLLSYHQDLAAGASVVVVSVVVFVATLLVRGGTSGYVSTHPSHSAHSHPGHRH